MVQPLVNVFIGQPAAPVDDQHLLQVKGVHGQDDINKSQPAEMEQLRKNFFFFIILQRAVKNIVPLVELHQHEHHAQGQRNDGQQQQIGFFLFLTLPIRFGQRPDIFNKADAFIHFFHLMTPLHYYEY